MLALLLVFISIPILEVLLLIEVSGKIGAMNTFSLVLLSGLLGILFTRREGREVLFQLRQDTGRGVLPAESMLHGLLIFCGGILLIIPGFISDFFGLILLVPYSRRLVVGRLKAWLQKSMREGKIKVQTFGGGTGFHAQGAYYERSSYPEEKEIREAKVIDIETKRLEREKHELPH